MSTLDDRVRDARDRLDTNVDIETPAFASVRATARRRRALRYGAAGTFVAASVVAIAFAVAGPEGHSTVKIGPAATSTTVAPTTTTPTTSAPAVDTTETTLPAAAALPQVVDCAGGEPQTRPTELILACGDGGIRALDLAWETWDADHAVGSGRVGLNRCVPDCATGGRDYYPATFEATNAQTIEGSPYFTTLNITFTDASPASKPTVSCPLAAGSQLGGCADEFSPQQAPCEAGAMLPMLKATIDNDVIQIDRVEIDNCINGYAEVNAISDQMCNGTHCYDAIHVILKDDRGTWVRTTLSGAGPCQEPLTDDERQACIALGNEIIPA